MKWFKHSRGIGELEEIVSKSVRVAVESSLKDSKHILTYQRDINVLTDERRKLKDELADIKKEKELEKIEIEHLVALKEERMKLEMSQKEVALEKEFQKKELSLAKKSYTDMVDRINKASEDMKQIYSEIMLRLPNVNLKGKI